MIKNYVIAAAAILATSSLLAQETVPQKCADQEIYSLLDFWVGEWVVNARDKKAGENNIQKILNGCAISEEWQGADGGRGQSLFFVDTDGNWQQVWVTEWAANPGGVKEKALVKKIDGGGVRFQGSISRPDASSYLDRTTLTPNADGTVRQLIEVSMDGGESWRSTFDAIYVREE